MGSDSVSLEAALGLPALPHSSTAAAAAQLPPQQCFASAESPPEAGRALKEDCQAEQGLFTNEAFVNPWERPPKRQKSLPLPILSWLEKVERAQLLTQQGQSFPPTLPVLLFHFPVPLSLGRHWKRKGTTGAAWEF